MPATAAATDARRPARPSARRRARGATCAGSRGRRRRANRHVVARRELLAIAPDDEQGVVDARAEPEHHPERGRGAREVRERGAEGQQHHAGDERDERGDQRERHRRDRAEHEREHEDGDGDADELADPERLLLGAVDHRPVAIGGDPGTLGDPRRLPEPLARLAPSSLAGRSYWTATKAVRPSRETRPRPAGESESTAAVTWGWAAMATARPIAAGRRPLRSVPESTLKTTLAASPDCAGKRCSRRS